MRIAFVSVALLLAFGAEHADAQMVSTLRATLAPVAEAPVPVEAAAKEATNAANAARAGGAAQFTIDQATHMLRWNVSYAGLSSDAVSAHIHTAAGPGVAPVIIVDLGKNGTASPLIGSTRLDDTQLADLMAGRDFVDVHTKLNENGEITGQIVP